MPPPKHTIEGFLEFSRERLTTMTAQRVGEYCADYLNNRIRAHALHLTYVDGEMVVLNSAQVAEHLYSEQAKEELEQELQPENDSIGG